MGGPGCGRGNRCGVKNRSGDRIGGGGHDDRRDHTGTARRGSGSRRNGGTVGGPRRVVSRGGRNSEGDMAVQSPGRGTGAHGGRADGRHPRLVDAPRESCPGDYGPTSLRHGRPLPECMVSRARRNRPRCRYRRERRRQRRRQRYIRRPGHHSDCGGARSGCERPSRPEQPQQPPHTAGPSHRWDAAWPCPGSPVGWGRSPQALGRTRCTPTRGDH